MPTSDADLIQLMMRMSVFVRRIPKAPMIANGQADFVIGIMRRALKLEKIFLK